MRILDLYCGIGGGSLGLRNAGFEPAFACDLDPDARLVYAYNFMSRDLRGDINALDAKSITHPEVIFAAPNSKDLAPALRLINEIKPRAIVFEFPARMIDRSKLKKKREIELGEYRCWHETLNTNDFGLAQKRKLLYIVGFRKDIKPAFNGFPFPDATDSSKTLASIFDQNPSSELFVDEERLKLIKGKNAKNREAGVGWRTQIYGGDHIAPSLPIAYHKDYRSILVDSGTGPRRLSVLECKRLMGFSDDFKMPVSDTTAYRLLAQASCPPVVEAVAKELKVWLS